MTPLGPRPSCIERLVEYLFGRIIARIVSEKVRAEFRRRDENLRRIAGAGMQ